MKTIRIRAEVLAGLTTSFALVPECIAFALVAHLNPLMGLYGAFIICTLTALFGGRPGMVSGAAGSMAVVIVALVVQQGVQYLLATVLLGGLIMILFGLLRLGKLVRLVPYPVMLGFVNGLAIVIAMAQLEHFKVGESWLSGTPLYVMLGLVALTMAIVYLLPRLTRIAPPALVAILSVGLAVYLLGLPTRTLGDMAHIAGGLPETLLTLNLTDEITETRGYPDRECVALGAANVVSGAFGGMGGCAMIGQTVINLSSGGRGRLSGVVAGLMILMFVLFLSPLIERIPLAALVGVMFVVAQQTFAWASLRVLRKVPVNDVLAIIA
ncbi:sulfate transporter, partial [Pseudomonas syringae pv. syringae]